MRRIHGLAAFLCTHCGHMTDHRAIAWIGDSDRLPRRGIDPLAINEAGCLKQGRIEQTIRRRGQFLRHGTSLIR
jgi:hypothetical protein